MRILCVGVLVLLAGCVTTAEPAAVSTEQPVETISPDGAEESALSVVRQYFDVSALVASDGGADPERIAPVVTANWLPHELAGFDALRSLGSSQVGTPTVTKMEIAAVRGIAAVSEVVVYACTSLDGVAVTTAEGEIDAPQGVTLITVYVVPENGELKVDDVEPWTDASWCDEA